MLLQESRKLSTGGLYKPLVVSFVVHTTASSIISLKETTDTYDLFMLTKKTGFQLKIFGKSPLLVLIFLVIMHYGVIEITAIILQSIRFLRAPGSFLRAYMSCRKNETIRLWLITLVD